MKGQEEGGETAYGHLSGEGEREVDVVDDGVGEDLNL